MSNGHRFSEHSFRSEPCSSHVHPGGRSWAETLNICGRSQCSTATVGAFPGPSPRVRVIWLLLVVVFFFCFLPLRSVEHIFKAVKLVHVRTVASNVTTSRTHNGRHREQQQQTCNSHQPKLCACDYMIPAGTHKGRWKHRETRVGYTACVCRLGGRSTTSRLTMLPSFWGYSLTSAAFTPLFSV